jgi:serine/threonine protein phosphatase PrpC
MNCTTTKKSIMSELSANILFAMEEEERKETDMKMITMSECFVQQLCAKQDISAVLTLPEVEGQPGDEPVEVIAVLDGHGHDVSVDIIREENFHEHFAKTDPAESLQQALDEKIPIRQKEANSVQFVQGTSFREYLRKKITNFDVEKSGLTLSFAKIYRNTMTKKLKIVPEWLGDSPINVFVNGELVFNSEIHNALNEAEVERLKNSGVISGTEKGLGGFKVLSEDRIESKPGTYIKFNSGQLLALTRSIGHNRILGIEPQKHVIECSTEDDVKILIYSDGVGDMLNMSIDLEKLKRLSAEELVLLAEKRWKQSWHLKDLYCTFPANGYDDCACAVWEQKKI